ncbi:MAG: hypothetical protein ACRC1T_04895 [Clostridium chrysemydis]|uniref:hypothetical protein n=1 Tax=Clostridium chrysemydis TaxID=2665504 RepID=UPI003F30B423
MVNLIEFINPINLGNGLWIIDNEEFFGKVNDKHIGVKTLVYENYFIKDKCQEAMKGQSLKEKIDNISLEEYYENPYILIICDTDNLIVRLECYDTFEKELVNYEWEVKSLWNK